MRVSENISIKELLSKLDWDTPYGSSDLQALGLPSTAAARLAQSGWLKKFGRGVYQMPNAKLDIQGHTTVCEHNLSKNIQVPVLSHFELFGSKFFTAMDR